MAGTCSSIELNSSPTVRNCPWRNTQCRPQLVFLITGNYSSPKTFLCWCWCREYHLALNSTCRLAKPVAYRSVTVSDHRWRCCCCFGMSYPPASPTGLFSPFLLEWREYFRLLMETVWIFQGQWFSHDLTLLQRNKYFLARKLVGWSILQGGHGPRTGRY